MGSASDPKLRKKYVELVEGVQQKGAEVVMFSSMHESGQRTSSTVVLYSNANHVTELNQLTGIAAILTFPLDVEVVEAEEKEAREEKRKQEEEAEAPDGGAG